MPPTDPQLELTFASAAAERSPHVTSCDVARLVAALRGQGWLRRRDIVARWPEFQDERRVRAIAHASKKAVVSYPGSLGYKVFDDCTEAEVHHARSAIASQIREMTEGLADLDRRHHRGPLVDRPQAG